MDAAPDTMTGREVDPSGRYRCALCKVQKVAVDGPDIGWMPCPMIDNQVICLGCCLDYQSIARSDVFNKHAFRGDFDRLAQRTGKDVTTLRLICMQHQQSVLLADLEQGTEPHLADEKRALLKTLKERMKSLEEGS